ncbi:MAG: DUF5676 family membrane protein [Candidatus Woesearchaeota archaeon]|nr:DUF5676 family membrane protein [Candidatus Woesearchaeota archaeon]
MNNKLNETALAYAGAIIGALCMLLIGLFGNAGMYRGMATLMMQSHMWFSLSPAGILFGMIEAAIIGGIFGYIFGLIYNKFA